MRLLTHIAPLALLACASEPELATSFGQNFEPQYVGGYPTAETADRMFEEYDGIKMPDDVVMTVQDRAYTSPIWYTPSR